MVEFPDRVLLTNVGDFLPGDVETVIRQDAPQAIYRNPFLADAMVELNLIDTQGGGIKRMFETQRRRSFPLPDYDLTEPEQVAVSITGRILDERYTRLLMERTDLDLGQVMLLDRVQKGQRIGRDEHRRLKAAGLVEGRYPNLIVAGAVAQGDRRGGPAHPRARLRQAVLPGPDPGAGAGAWAGSREGRGRAPAREASGPPHRRAEAAEGPQPPAGAAPRRAHREPGHRSRPQWVAGSE